MTDKSKASIGKKLAISAAGAGLLLLTTVLPAEYGLDPTGLGKMMGLTALAQEVTAKPAPFEGKLEFNVQDYDTSAEIIQGSIKGLVYMQDVPFKTQIIDIQIEDLGEVEYKFIMDGDASFVYSWEALDANGANVEYGVYYDFHGHPSTDDAKNYPDGFEMAYSKSEGTQQSGSFTAPFPGYHGFYFMNIEEGPITVKLNISGYWNDQKEMYRAVDGKVITKVEF